MKNRENLVYEAEVTIGRERVSLRFLILDALMLLERELTQADGSTFMHSIWVDGGSTLFDYMTADPYFMQLERHYGLIQEKMSRVLAP
ncbi:hypothetical protein ACNRBS_06275 [Ralstonia pseudosolanacearum]|uniref:Uncharacterized protein n=2 Tax=Ralstonia solanacearum species complex TaxID=3116862 RepID=A0A0S4WL36_RALSL|nr:MULTISPECIES: hypothetical protein [Ralstonia solanacearum species complex]CUV47472.1 protein of unknown function [Ralstonia solanacearum]MDO3524981.1 hypothetical protein [Ralstonia pseudosolanacearum]MDO3527126.1 hypothetical protein [Ralstonia pseudosolanacearum]MDO3531731.1 hypothetical protein [Ralstonia pseudosolanacearum]MDO3549413.1 hypothetical protein [Ralstonia pseudosolanacearum]